MNDDHVRSVTFGSDLEIRSEQNGDGLTIFGWVARFNEPTTIEDWLGQYVERIKPGAFTKTLLERGPAKVRMQWAHGHDSAFGQLPIGVWTTLEEKRQGLYGEGRILDTWHTVPIRAAVEAGAVDGFSFRFRTIREELRTGDPAKGQLDERDLLEVALYEAGPVGSAAYPGATLSLRSAVDLYRQASSNVRTIPVVDATVNTDNEKDEAGTAMGVTRQVMRREALTRLLGDIHAEPDRGTA